MLHFNFVFVLFLLTHLAFGQARDITVRVLDGVTKKPVNKVNVVVGGTTRGTVTNILGYFRVNLLPSEKNLVISHVTYTTATIVVPDSVNTFTVELQRNVQLLPEIDLREYPNGFVMENAKEKDLKKFPVKADSLIVVEFNAGFPYEGGINTFYDFFGNTFKFPEKELLEKEEGKVLIGFTIDKNGDYQNVHCPIGQGSKLCEEFKRILTELPKWTPGEQRGDPVEQSFAMFVRYGMNAYWERKIRN